MGRNTNTPKSLQTIDEQEAIEQTYYESLMSKITQFLDEKGIAKEDYQVIIVGPIDQMIQAQADLVLSFNEDLKNAELVIIEKDQLISDNKAEITKLLQQKESLLAQVEELKGKIPTKSMDEPYTSAKEEIDPERALHIASAQADIEALIAAKRGG